MIFLLLLEKAIIEQNPSTLMDTKRIVVDIEEHKVDFVIELLEHFDFVRVLADTDEENRGMYDAIVSLQKGMGIPDANTSKS